MTWILLCMTGVAAGILSGLFGVGGGIVMVPMMMFALKMPIHTANATSLVALAIPVGLLISIYNYYSAGKIDSHHILYGAIMATGLAMGAFFGSRLAVSLDQEMLRKCFAVFLIIVAVLMWFKK